MRYIRGVKVRHRYRNYPVGKVIRAEYGCNTVYWVDFGKEFLTICIEKDLVPVL
jgi:hypothetical protein